MGKYFESPDFIQQTFDAAEDFVKSYFNCRQNFPENGIINIKGERYILIRAASMSVELFKTIKLLSQSVNSDQAFEIARNLLYDLSYAIGKKDAIYFYQTQKREKPANLFSIGPAFFAFSGWGRVRLLPESDMTSDKDFLLLYEHENSFESDSWKAANLQSPMPVCVMNAGYSAGWTSEAFSRELVSAEILCRAKGDPACRFLMAPPDRIQELYQNYCQRQHLDRKDIPAYSLASFFKRKLIEDKLHQFEIQFERLFNSANDAIFVLKNRTIEHINSVGINMLGKKPHEIIGKDILVFSSRKQIDNADSKLLWLEKLNTVTSGKPAIFEWNFQKPNGQLVTTEISLNLLDSNGPNLQAICRDVTERKLIEQRSLQSQKLEVIGSLAEGIAHDFNNILGGMLGFVSLLKIKLSSTDENSKYLERISDSIEKAASLTNQLLLFSKKSRLQSIPLQLNAQILPVVEIVKRSFKDRVNFSILLAEDLRPINGDPSQIDQVIMNLCLNAAQSIPDVGEIKVETFMASSEYLEMNTIKDFISPSAVALKITDDGIGMDEAVIQQIFEPYFSARNDNKGFGLGMPIVYNILKNHHGRITISSKPGNGTTVHVFLPPTDKKLPATSNECETFENGTEMILVGDDEEMIVEILKEFLESLGYKVFVATDCLSIKQILDDTNQHCDLVIINYGMTKKGGKSFLAELTEEHRDIKFILCSGLIFSEDELQQFSTQMGISDFIQKPFKLSEISRIIRKTLDEQR